MEQKTIKISVWRSLRHISKAITIYLFIELLENQHKMAKDFKSRIGSKRLNTLIPENDPIHSSQPEAASEPKSIIKKQMIRAVEQEPEQAPTPPETVVSTFRINAEKLTTIKAIAFWDRKKIQDVFDEALGLYIEAQEKATLEKAVEEYTKRTA